MPTPYHCTICGQAHEDWPALVYPTPAAYYHLTETEKGELATVSDDFCVITYEDQTDRFIRTVLWQEVTDHPEDLHYGLWVSLSAASFADYEAHYNDEDHQTEYFGWLANPLPDYDFSVSIPHEDFDHPFVRDYYAGIPRKEAERRIHAMMGG